jgi:hypothetical protein
VYYFFFCVIFQLLSSGDIQNIFSLHYDRKRNSHVSQHDTCKSSFLECIPRVILKQARLRTLRGNETIPSSPRDFWCKYKGLVHRSTNKCSLVHPPPVNANQKLCASMENITRFLRRSSCSRNILLVNVNPINPIYSVSLSQR